MAAVGDWRRNFREDDRKTADHGTDNFNKCARKLQRMVYRDTDEFRSDIGAVLDEINCIDYTSPVQTEEVI